MKVTKSTRKDLYRAVAKFLAYVALGDEDEILHWASLIHAEVEALEDRALRNAHEGGEGAA